MITTVCRVKLLRRFSPPAGARRDFEQKMKLGNKCENAYLALEFTIALYYTISIG